MVLSKSFEAYSLNSFEIAAKHPKQKVNVGVLGLGDSNCVIIAMTVGHALTRVRTLWQFVFFNTCARIECDIATVRVCLVLTHVVRTGRGFLKKTRTFFHGRRPRCYLSDSFTSQIDHNDDSSCSNSRLLSNARRRAKKMHHNCTGGSFIRLRSPQLIFLWDLK